MKKMLCLLLLFFMLLPINTQAIHDVIDSRCTNSLKLSLREEGKDVLYRLAKNVEGASITYTAYLYNLTENIYITDSDGKIYNDSKITNLKPGSAFIMNIYASNKTYCEGYKIASKIIRVPYYNPYFGSDLCSGYENYSLCKENVNVTISQEEFEKKLNIYKESLKNDEDKEVIDETVTEEVFNLYDFILDYKYYLISFLTVVLICTISIVLINHRKNKGIL